MTCARLAAAAMVASCRSPLLPSPFVRIRGRESSGVAAARRYYTAATATPWKQLLGDALVKARDAEFDVFNALDVLENTPALLKDLKFGIGDGNLHYYLFNWRVHTPLDPREVGLILT